MTSADLKEKTQTILTRSCILQLFSRWHAHDPPPGASHLQHGVPGVSEPCDPVGLVDLVLMRIMYEHHWHHPTRRRMARERRGAGSSLVSMETPYYKQYIKDVL